jgi:hypothetical protein
MGYQVWFRLGIAALLAAVPVVACSGKPQSPVSPDGAMHGLFGVNPDGSTLKVQAPAPLSPLDGVRLKDRRPIFLFQNAQGVYVGTKLDYEVEIFGSEGHLVFRSPHIKQGLSETTYTYPDRLDSNTPYSWRVRAVLAHPAGGFAHGPWSSSAQGHFITVDRPDLTPENMLPFIIQFSADHPEWDTCTTKGDGVACHRFVRAVAQAANPGCDPTSWGLLSKNPGEWQCTMSACGPLGGQGFGEDILTYGGLSPLGMYDIILGAGLPGSMLVWQDISWTKRAGNEWACPW